MENEAAGRCRTLAQLLSESDVVTIHTPLNGETRGLSGMEELRMMKSSALLINCARGGIVEEAALISALKDGIIAGAGVDVTVEEPLTAENPLCSAPNLIISPHSAAQDKGGHHPRRHHVRGRLHRRDARGTMAGGGKSGGL